MIRKTEKKQIRSRIHDRIRRKLRGTTERPRLAVFRSVAHIYAQVIDDSQGATLVSASSVDKAGKMVAPPGTVDDFNKYLELQPEGPYAEGAKQMLDTLGAKISTGFKKK